MEVNESLLHQLIEQSECLDIPSILFKAPGISAKGCIALTVIHGLQGSDRFNAVKLAKHWLFTDEKNIKRLLANLIKSGFLVETVLSNEMILEIIKTKKPQDFVYGNLTCEWCSAKTLVLHEHHYPIRRSLGGEKVVSICPNCHTEFHILESRKLYTLTDKALFYFQEDADV